MNIIGYGLIGFSLLVLSKIDQRLPPPAPAPPRLSDEEFLSIVEEAFDKTFGKRENVDVAETETSLLDLKPTSSDSLPDKLAIEAGKWLPLIQHPCVVVILGKRGSGKAALAYRLLELMRWIAPIFVVGLPASANKYIPDWIELQGLGGYTPIFAAIPLP